MKALMVGWELPPHHTGGLGVACLQLCKQLSREGVDIEFMLPYTSRDHEQIDFMNVHGATTIVPEQLGNYWSAYSSAGFADETDPISEQVEVGPDGLSISELEQLYQNSIVQSAVDIDFDVIHAHDWLTMRSALRLKQATGKPLITHVHATEFDRAGGNFGNPLIHEIEWTGLNGSDTIIAVSQRIKDMVVKHYHIDPDKVSVQRNGLDLDQEVKQATPLKTNSFQYLWEMRKLGYQIVGYTGRLTMQKNLHTLIRSMADVIRLRPKTLLLLIGSGDQRDELVAYAAEHGIGAQTIFVEFAKGKVWRDSFDMQDVSVMPSVSEPFGITPLEAACFGIPTIVTKQSGVAEVFNNCLKVDYWDQTMLTAMIYELLDSPALHGELSKNSQAEVDRLDWREPAQNIRRLYHSQEVPA